MLSYFRINDPYRLVVIFFFLILIRLTVFLGDFPLMSSELKWMVIGEKLSNGANLYVGLWDNIPPLAAWVYKLIDKVFGRSPTTFHVLSLLIIFFQAFLLNNILLKHRVYNEYTYIPALLYIILASSFFDFYTLSPTLMGVTFIILALDNIFTHLSERRNDQLVFLTGVYLGVANLFYYPSFIVVIATFIGYALLTVTILRRYLLLCLGYFLPLLITWSIFFLKDGTTEFYNNFIFSLFNVKSKRLMDPLSIFSISAFPFLFIILAIFRTLNNTRINNQQERIQKTMLVLFIIAGLGWYFNKEKSSYQLTILIPSAVFFLSHYFLNIRKRWKAEAIFSSFVIGVLVINIITYNRLPYTKKIVNYDNLIVKDTEWNELVKGKKILFIGDQIDIYKQAQLATPYLNWDLAKSHLNSPDYYESITEIYKNLNRELPEVIIDDKGVMQQIMLKMPGIKAKYSYNAARKTYVLRPF